MNSCLCNEVVDVLKVCVSIQVLQSVLLNFIIFFQIYLFVLSSTVNSFKFIKN